jgi:hypothetical protein
VTSFATSETVAAWATVAAVVVALVGPLLHDLLKRARTRPSLTLDVEQPEGFASHRHPRNKNTEITLLVRNADDRNRAEHVEVFASVLEILDAPASDDFILSHLFRQASLTLTDGRVSSVAAGFGRIVHLATLEAPTFAYPGPANCGTWGVEGRPPLSTNATYIVELTVTGSDFNAQTYVGKFRVSDGARDQDGVLMAAKFKWTQMPTINRAARHPPPSTPPRTGTFAATWTPPDRR